jgi:hypothetical protein
MRFEDANEGIHITDSETDNKETLPDLRLTLQYNGVTRIQKQVGRIEDVGTQQPSGVQRPSLSREKP